MQDSNKIAIIVPNHFQSFQFDDAVKNLPRIGNIDIISSESGKIKSWDKMEKEYHTVVLYKNKISEVNPLDYTTIIVHEMLIGEQSIYFPAETISFINRFMGRMKPIVAVCQNHWTVIIGSKLDKAFDHTSLESRFKISA